MIFSHLKLDQILHLLIPNLLVLYLILGRAIFEASSTMLLGQFLTSSKAETSKKNWTKISA